MFNKLCILISVLAFVYYFLIGWHSEYPYLARLLQTEDRAEFNTCSKLMELFGPELEQRINPAELMAALRAKDVISAHDQEVILAKQANEGAIAAAMTLLERIQTRLEPSEWYIRFLQVKTNTAH